MRSTTQAQDRYTSSNEIFIAGYGTIVLHSIYGDPTSLVVEARLLNPDEPTRLFCTKNPNIPPRGAYTDGAMNVYNHITTTRSTEQFKRTPLNNKFVDFFCSNIRANNKGDARLIKNSFNRAIRLPNPAASAAAPAATEPPAAGAPRRRRSQPRRTNPPAPQSSRGVSSSAINTTSTEEISIPGYGTIVLHSILGDPTSLVVEARLLDPSEPTRLFCTKNPNIRPKGAYTDGAINVYNHITTTRTTEQFKRTPLNNKFVDFFCSNIRANNKADARLIENSFSQAARLPNPAAPTAAPAAAEPRRRQSQPRRTTPAPLTLDADEAMAQRRQRIEERKKQRKIIDNKWPVAAGTDKKGVLYLANNNKAKMQVIQPSSSTNPNDVILVFLDSDGDINRIFGNNKTLCQEYISDHQGRQGDERKKIKYEGTIADIDYRVRTADQSTEANVKKFRPAVGPIIGNIMNQQRSSRSSPSAAPSSAAPPTPIVLDAGTHAPSPEQFNPPQKNAVAVAKKEARKAERLANEEALRRFNQEQKENKGKVVVIDADAAKAAATPSEDSPSTSEYQETPPIVTPQSKETWRLTTAQPEKMVYLGLKYKTDESGKFKQTFAVGYFLLHFNIKGQDVLAIGCKNMLNKENESGHAMHFFSNTPERLDKIVGNHPQKIPAIALENRAHKYKGKNALMANIYKTIEGLVLDESNPTYISECQALIKNSETDASYPRNRVTSRIGLTGSPTPGR